MKGYKGFNKDLQCRGKLAQHRGSGNRGATFDLGDHRAAHARQRPEPIEGELRLQAQTSKIGRERFGALTFRPGLGSGGVRHGPRSSQDGCVGSRWR